MKMRWTVLAFTGNEELIYRKVFKNPESAIKAWFKIARVYPTMASISCNTKVEAMELINWSTKNKDKISKFHSDYNSYLKLEYILEEVDRQKENGIRFFHESEFGGDSIHPFSIG